MWELLLGFGMLFGTEVVTLLFHRFASRCGVKQRKEWSDIVGGYFFFRCHCVSTSTYEIQRMLILYRLILLMEEILHRPAPVEVGSLSHHLQGFVHRNGGCLGFFPLTVCAEKYTSRKHDCRMFYLVLPSHGMPWCFVTANQPTHGFMLEMSRIFAGRGGSANG